MYIGTTAAAPEFKLIDKSARVQMIVAVRDV